MLEMGEGFGVSGEESGVISNATSNATDTVELGLDQTGKYD
jgi:hypothetical protein